jgi:hypothetical protein
MADKQMPIPVGFQWQHPVSGKQWVVTGLRPGGLCEVHRVGQYISGVHYARDIRAAVAAGTALPMALTEPAQAILRRING